MERVLKNITNGSKQRTETKRQRRGVAAADARTEVQAVEAPQAALARDEVLVSDSGADVDDKVGGASRDSDLPAASDNATTQDDVHSEAPMLSALHAALFGDGDGLTEAITMVEQGADVHEIWIDGGCTYTLLWLAASAVLNGYQGGLALATLAVAKGVNVNAAVGSGDGRMATPLLLAASAVALGMEGALALVKTLVEHGADVNAVKKGKRGEDCTSLRLAASAWRDGVDDAREERARDAQDLVRFLVSNGARLATGEIAEWQHHVDDARH